MRADSNGLTPASTHISLSRDTSVVLGQIRFGMMLYSPAGPGILRGNLEGIIEAYVS